ncbi:MAG TPA: carboxypeptidase-like regulatory domain-containing protein [Bacteroidia bacterium]|nr:carboxypeptidase-like regulatory domain-containing protein [Bacteroidia bacterium]
MTTAQSNRERMGDRTLNVLTQGSTIYQGSPQFQGYVTAHSGNLTKVREWKNKQAIAIEIKGMTEVKNAFRAFIAGDVSVIIGAIRSLSTDTGNSELWQSVNYSNSRLAKSKETIFIADCTQVLNVATANAAPLVPYGVTAQMITNLGADILTYQGMMTKGTTKRADVATYTLNLKNAIKKMMTHLQRAVDNSIKQFKSAAPDFVNSYKTARVVINYAATETGAHGKVTDKDTSQILKGVIVEIVELQRLASTNSHGVYEFRRLQEGNYTIRFRKNGYIITEMPLLLEKDKFKQFDMEIEHQPVSVPAAVV